MRKVTIYTDGSCNPNPGLGGWGYVVFEDGREPVEGCGGEKQTTNNQMEITAAVMALKSLETRTEVTIYTDSQYVRKGITSWVKGWKRNGWMTASRKPVKNKELWQELEKSTGDHIITWKWVKGHSGNAGNELADKLAEQGRQKAILGNVSSIINDEKESVLRGCLNSVGIMSIEDLNILRQACTAAIIIKQNKAS
jgi:ribonuclease HI